MVAKQIHAGWKVDVDPPVVIMQVPSPAIVRNCYTDTSWTTLNFTFHVTDNLAGIVWIKADVVGAVPANNKIQNLAPPFPTSYDWITTMNSTGMVNNGTYSLVLTAHDGAGNTSSNYTPISNFIYKIGSVCGTPWIQTVGGDVHSNNSISIPTPAP